MAWASTGASIKGPTGATGPAGPVGAAGIRGTLWYTGTGPPPVTLTPTPIVGDLYLDLTSGTVYRFN